MENQKDIEQDIEQEEKNETQDLEQTEAQEEKIEDSQKTEEDSLEKKLEKAEALAKDYLDRLQRNMAEFDNFRKRTIMEKASMYENGARDTIEKFLPILDNFERAILSTAEQEKESATYKGVEMIFNQMLEAFKAMNVEEVAGVGENFDPNMHNAVLHIEDETLGENVVAEVLQKGYMHKDKVIRPSMVKVAN